MCGVSDPFSHCGRHGKKLTLYSFWVHVLVWSRFDLSGPCAGMAFQALNLNHAFELTISPARTMVVFSLLVSSSALLKPACFQVSLIATEVTK